MERITNRHEPIYSFFMKSRIPDSKDGSLNLVLYDRRHPVNQVSKGHGPPGRQQLQHVPNVENKEAAATNAPPPRGKKVVYSWNDYVTSSQSTLLFCVFPSHVIGSVPRIVSRPRNRQHTTNGRPLRRYMSRHTTRSRRSGFEKNVLTRDSWYQSIYTTTWYTGYHRASLLRLLPKAFDRPTIMIHPPPPPLFTNRTLREK